MANERTQELTQIVRCCVSEIVKIFYCYCNTSGKIPFFTVGQILLSSPHNKQFRGQGPAFKYHIHYQGYIERRLVIYLGS